MAQKTDAQLSTESDVIKNETTAGANTATRVAAMVQDVIDSKSNNTRNVAGHPLSADVILVKGDVGLGSVDNTSDGTKNSAIATLTNKTLTAPVINSATGIVKADVGLSNVDNVSQIAGDVVTLSTANTYTDSQITAALAGLNWKDDVVATTTVNITLSGAQTIDTVSVVAGNDVLVKDQTTQSQNGIYTVASGAWVRKSNAATGTNILGMVVQVDFSGGANSGTIWRLTTAAPIAVGTTALTFSQFSASVPSASPTTSGIAKLYNTTGSNTDGGVDQNTITTQLGLKQNTLTNTDGLSEGSTNFYFTFARVLASVLTGLSTATNAVITNSDTVLSAFGKLQKQISDIIIPVKSIASEINTGTDDAKFTTALGLEGSKYLNQTLSKISGTTSGTNTYALTLTPAPSVYPNFLNIKIGTTNTGASTLTINALTAVSLTKNGSGALISGDLISGNVYSLSFDGTGYQVIAGLAGTSVSSASPSVSGIAKLYSTTGSNTDGSIDQNTITTQLGLKEVFTNKDTTGGYAGLTLFKINLRNVANTITSFFTNSNTAARTYTLPDSSGTVALTTDITGTNSGANTGDETDARIGTIITNATNYATPLDADKIGIYDVADSLFKYVTWANIKSVISSTLTLLQNKILNIGKISTTYAATINVDLANQYFTATNEITGITGNFVLNLNNAPGTNSVLYGTVILKFPSAGTYTITLGGSTPTLVHQDGGAAITTLAYTTTAANEVKFMTYAIDNTVCYQITESNLTTIIRQGGNAFGTTVTIGTIDSVDTILVANAIEHLRVISGGGVKIIGFGTTTLSALEVFDNTGTQSRFKVLDNGQISVTGAIDQRFETAGGGIAIKTGTNAKAGTVTLVAGTATVSTSKCTTGSMVITVIKSLGTVTIPSSIEATPAAGSFTLVSSSVTDTSVIQWFIVELL